VGAQAETDLTTGGLFGDPPTGWDLARAGRLTLRTGLPLRAVALSHGWSALAPSCYDADRGVLHRTLALPDAGPVTVSVRQAAGGLTVSWGRPISTGDRAAVRRQLRHMLCLDDDLSELWSTAPSWVRELGMGRLLRSPTVWEDLARTLATTNCSWSLTRLVVARLVDTLGEEGAAGERAFPTPEAVRDAGEAHLRDVVRAGYRARAFIELATAVADGSLGADRWFDPALPDDVVEQEVRALRGFGPYASEGMLGLLGRPKGFALDSWIRARLPELLGRAAMTDAQIRDRYVPHGRWAGTVLWCELTRDW
jgi:3-methyladenine DNA glycosylase/8-oxoguanine DNA glycosylase